MRKALIVGIDYYDEIASLSGAVRDALRVKKLLERNADGRVNFTQPRLMVACHRDDRVSKSQLRHAAQSLFAEDVEIALFYFSGHGYIDVTGGYLCASDYSEGVGGLPLRDIMDFANNSPAKNKVILIDSCHSGSVASNSFDSRVAEIKEGVTVLTASTADQYAMEKDGAGLFTSLLVDALNGAASNLTGDITPGSIYAHIDQSLGPWEQRPVFKTNVKKFISLRTVAAPIRLEDLRRINELFQDPETQLPLDPSYEPERSSCELTSVPAPDPRKNRDFAVLQAMAAVNLVRPVGVLHMWHAAMQSKSCELTVLGKYYWSLVNKGLI